MNHKYQNKIKYLAVTILFTIIFNISSLSFASAASSSSLISLANSSRAEAGLGSLSSNGQLESAALAKANDMLTNQYFAHTSPQGKNPWDFIKAAGYSYVYAGENLSIGYSDNTELHNAWMNSPTHRENIMSPNFREIGIAVLEGSYEGENTTIVVQMFGSTESTQPVSQIKDVQPTVNETSKSKTATASKKDFEILSDGTSFSPAKIFQGDKVEFKVSLKGNIKEAYIMVGTQKIDLKDALSAQSNIDIKNLVKQEAINDKGKLQVDLTVIGANDIKESKNLGVLEVNAKVIAGESDNQSFLVSLVQNMNNHLQTYLITISLIVLLAMSYFVFRFKKYGKLI